MPVRPVDTPARPRAPVLELTGVCKSWADGTVVLDDVALTVGAGERVWLHGRNGVGKTTLLRTAAGILRPDRGTVCASGVDVERQRATFHRSVALLSASASGLYARLRVRHHLELWCALALVPSRDRHRAIADAIATMHLEELMDRRVDRLSMGQRQRVRLAGTFLHDAGVVLLDEPANSLDDEGLAYLQQAVERVSERGGAVVWCSPSGQAPAGGFDAAWQLEAGTLSPT